MNLNLNIGGRRSPADYSAPLAGGNARWEETLRSHVLDGDVQQPIQSDDFPASLASRSQQLSVLAREQVDE